MDKMLDIIIANTQIDIETSINLSITCKDLDIDLRGFIYAEWYKYFPSIISMYEKYTKKTFYHVIDDADIRLLKLLNLLKELDIDTDHLSPLLTNEFIISHKNENTLLFLGAIYTFVSNHYPDYIPDYFIIFMMNYNIDQNPMIYVDYMFDFTIDHDDDFNFNFRYELILPLIEREKQLIYHIMNTRNPRFRQVRYVHSL
jgi:hypothetical protein